MKHLAIILAGFVAMPAMAAPDTDFPHRDWGQIATLDMTVDEATSCIARELNRFGDATVLPMAGGNDIDFAAHPMWGPKMEPWQTFKVRSEDGATKLRVFYRHPVKKASVSKDVTRMQKRCLKVQKIDPLPPA